MTKTFTNMKRHLLLKTMLLLCALVVGTSSSWAGTENITLSNGTFSTDHITWEGSSVTISQIKGNSGTNVNSSYISAPRVYKGNILSFVAKSGYTINSISITYDGKYYGNSMTAGTAISNNKVTDNTTDVSRTWSTANGGTHVVSSVSNDGLSAIYIQNVGATNVTTQLRPTAISITYSTSGEIAPPTFSPAAGAVTVGTTVALSQEANKTIRYTINGDDPTKSTGTVYSGTPIVINTPTTIKAIAVDGDEVSSVATASYTINVTEPTFSKAAGSVNEGTPMTISATEGDIIIFTTDGTDPSFENSVGEIYDGSAIVLDKPTTVKAIAVDDYGNESAITSAKYTINYAGAVDITPNYSFFGKASSFSGTTYKNISGTKDGVTVSVAAGKVSSTSDGNLYADGSSMRFYYTNTMTISAPANKKIVHIAFTQGNTTADDISSSPTGYTGYNHFWDGDASEVVFTRTSGSYISFTKITVVLADIATLNAACNDGEGNIYGTYSNESAFVVPAGLTVSTVKVGANGKLVVTPYETGDIVKANTGVMVSATSAGDKTIVLSLETGTEHDGNMLKPTGDGITADEMEEAAPNCTYYRLTMHNAKITPPGKIGFWWGAASGAKFAIAANKAYLAVPTGSLAKEGFTFEDTTTGINGVEEIAPVTKTRKVVKNGRLVIETANGEFTIDGARVK